MSTDTYSWNQPDEDLFKKEEMWLTHRCRNHHLSCKPANENGNPPEVKGATAFVAVLTSVMSLWWNSEEQDTLWKVPRSSEGPSGSPANRNSIEEKICNKKNEIFKTFVSTNSSNSRLQKECRSNGHPGITARHNGTSNHFHIFDQTINSSKGRQCNLEIAEDFGIRHNTIAILKDAFRTTASSRQFRKNQPLDRQGNCETVEKSAFQKENKPKSSQIQAINFEDTIIQNNTCLSALGILPILSCVIQVNQITELLMSQAHAIKNLLACAITVRLFLLKVIIEQCEHLARQGHFKVNQCDNTDIIPSDKIESVKNNTVTSSISGALNKVTGLSGEMDYRGVGNQFAGGDDGARMNEDDFMEEDNEAENQNFPGVPMFHRFVRGGEDEVADEEYDDAFERHMAGNGRDWGNGHHEVPSGDNSAAGQDSAQLRHDLLSHAICDHDVIAAILEEVHAPAQHQPPPDLPPPAEEEIHQFLMEDDQEWLEDLAIILRPEDFAANAA